MPELPHETGGRTRGQEQESICVTVLQVTATFLSEVIPSAGGAGAVAVAKQLPTVVKSSQ
jgi:hypothetical protein